MANLIWTYNSLAVDKPIDMGILAHLTETTDFAITISHDSRLEIAESGFYISPYEGEYTGSQSPQKDYERLLWLADNYPGFGLSIRQKYEVTGQFDKSEGIRLIDYTRTERVDIFNGAIIEIMSGSNVGETATISSYTPSNQLFILSSSFSTDVTNANYRISIDKERFITSNQGADYSSMIPLIYKGGVIQRNDSAEILLRLRIPKFAQSAGTFLSNLNMKFTSLEQI